MSIWRKTNVIGQQTIEELLADHEANSPHEGIASSHPTDTANVHGIANAGSLDSRLDAIDSAISSNNNKNVVNIKDFGGDFGAVGDGVVRTLSAATVASMGSFGFSGADRLDTMDTHDTEDWLAVMLAVKHLKSIGGGTCYVPRPAVSYPLHRFITLPVGVPIHVKGDGFKADQFDFDNNCTNAVGWEAAERRTVFQPSNWKDNCIDAAFATKSTTVAIAATDVSYTSIIPLAIGGGANFVVGDRVVIYTIAGYAVGASRAPNRSCLRRVVAISGDDLLLDDPISFRIASGNGMVGRMGTGSDGSLGGATFDFVEDLHVSGLNVRGSSSFAYGWAGRRCLVEDFGATADRAVSVGNNGALFLNGLADSTFRQLHLRSKNRGIEIKGMSGQRYTHDPDSERGGTGLLIQDYDITIFGLDAAIAPPLSVGESSNVKLERGSIVGTGQSWAAYLRIDDSELTIVRGLDLEGAGADGSKIGVQITGHKQPANKSVIDIAGLKQGGKALSWSRAITALDPGDGRPAPVIYHDGFRAGSTFGAFAAGAYAIPFVAYGSFSDFSSEAGETLGFTGTSIPVSPIKGILGATTAQIASAADWINTSYKKRGKAVYDTTTNRLLFPIGRAATSKWRPYDDMSGATDVTPA